MAFIQSKFAEGKLRSVSSYEASCGAPQRVYYDLPTTENVTGNIIEMGLVPAGFIPADMILQCDDLDDATALVLDVGMLSGKWGMLLNDDDTARTCGTEFFAAATTGQAGGVARLSTVAAFEVASVEYDRSIGVKVNTQAGTPAEGTIALTYWLRAGS